jgi:uncharacterized membrane protein YgdD (TMEM256/DUF423 family)
MIRRIASIMGATGVMAGAFGAHAIKDMVSPERLATWETAARYQLIHAVVLLGLSLLPTPPRGPAYLMTTGICIFSGSLYLLVLLDQPLLGAITPIGGVCLIGSWFWIGGTHRNDSR